MSTEVQHSTFIVFRYIVKSKENKIKDKTGEALNDESENAIAIAFNQKPEIENIFQNAELDLHTTVYDDKYEHEIEYLCEGKEGLTDENISKAHKFFIECLSIPNEKRKHLYFDLEKSEITKEQRKVTIDTEKTEINGLVNF